MFNRLIVILSTLFYTTLCGSNLLCIDNIGDACSDDVSISSNDVYSSNIDSYSDFKSSYFDNLTYNFGMNYKGSCGYVAIGMLLSYYDTYLNDDIVPEQYDVISDGDTYDMNDRRNSPGTYRDLLFDSYGNENGKKLSTTDYYNKIEALSDVSLHAKLITIGAKRGYFKKNNFKYPCETNFEQRYNILTDYLSTVLNYELNVDYTIESYGNEDFDNAITKKVKSFVVEQIQKGNPVLLAVRGIEDGHVVIAYDYDSYGNIYCNMGWNASKTHQKVEDSDYYFYKNALAINFTQSHSHTNNYAVTIDGKTSYYCYDNHYIDTHSNSKIHDYSYSYEKYSSKKHKSYCECGEFNYSNHYVDTLDIYSKGLIKYGTCSLCGEILNLTSNVYPIV